MSEFEKSATKKQKKNTVVNHDAIAKEYGKLPPQVLDLEESVLGALMIERDALTTVIDILQPVSFYKESHQKIYSSIQELFQKSEPVDILTVKNQLKINQKTINEIKKKM